MASEDQTDTELKNGYDQKLAQLSAAMNLMAADLLAQRLLVANLVRKLAVSAPDPAGEITRLIDATKVEFSQYVAALPDLNEGAVDAFTKAITRMENTITGQSRPNIVAQ